MTIDLHQGDLPDGLDLGGVVAVDSETMGLHPERDRLCVVQLSAGDGAAHLVQLAPGRLCGPEPAPAAGRPSRAQAVPFRPLRSAACCGATCGSTARPIYCTKIASRLVRTYTDRHGLKDLVRELLGIELDKAEQSSDWGADELSETQLRYAASDVLHLHALRARLDAMLAREGRTALAQACFDFLPFARRARSRRLAGPGHLRPLRPRPCTDRHVRRVDVAKSCPDTPRRPRCRARRNSRRSCRAAGIGKAIEPWCQLASPPQPAPPTPARTTARMRRSPAAAA